MDIYFLGDLHGNNYALEACLNYLDRMDAAQIICLGDLVGWLPFGNRTLERIRALDIPVVAGNHDLLVAGLFMDYPHQLDRMQASAYNAGLLSTCAGALDYLGNLPLILEYERFDVVHHSPFLLPAPGTGPSIQCFGYLDDQALSDSLGAWRAYGKRLIVSGHDHVPAVYELPDQTECPGLADVIVHRPGIQNDFTVKLHPDSRYWVKAGSVGGPYRDGVPLANLAVLDEDQQTITLKRVAYPTGSLYAELASHAFCRNLATLKKYVELLEGYCESTCRKN